MRSTSPRIDACRARRRRWASAAARAAIRGKTTGARAGLEAWSFSTEPRLLERLVDKMVASPPRPPARAWRAWMDPALDGVALSEDPLEAEATLLAQATDDPLGTLSTEDRVAWGLAALAHTGDLVQLGQGGLWLPERFRPEPALDDEVRGLWRDFFEGRAFEALPRFDALFAPAATEVFRALLCMRGLRETHPSILADLRDAFTYRWVMGTGGVQGWEELAVRVLETLEGGPVRPLVEALDEEALRALGAGVAEEGGYADTARLLWPRCEVSTAAGARLARWLGERPEVGLGVVELHAARRLVERWAEGEGTSGTRLQETLRHNVGRPRARLRALLSRRPTTRMAASIEQAPCLYHRTLRAIRTYCRTWFARESARGFSFDVRTTVETSCPQRPWLDRDWPEDAEAILGAWLLKVALRGHLEGLQAWVWCRGGTSRSSSLSAMLSHDLPDDFADPATAGARRRRERLRFELALSWEDRLEALTPHLDRIGALDLKKGRKSERFEVVLAPAWHPRIETPKVRVGTYVRNARHAARWIARRERTETYT